MNGRAVARRGRETLETVDKFLGPFHKLLSRDAVRQWTALGVGYVVNLIAEAPVPWKSGFEPLVRHGMGMTLGAPVPPQQAGSSRKSG